MSLILWNKLGSNTEINNSASGENGSIAGSLSFAAGKFGDGVNGVDESNYFYFPDILPVGLNAITLEMWIKPSFASDESTDFDRLIYTTPPSIFDGMWDIYCKNPDQIRVTIFSSAEFSYTPFSVYTFDVTWSANELFHFAITLDNNASTGETIKLYKNGSICNLSEFVETGGVGWNITTTLELYFTLFYHTNLIFDNLKIFNNIKTDFSDRLWEDGAGIPVNLTASQNTYADKIVLSWDAVIGDLIGYGIYRSTAINGIYSLIDTVNALTYNDLDINFEEHYFYKITSITAVAESDFSSIVEGWSQIIVLPTYMDIKDKNENIYNTKILIGNTDVWQKGLVQQFPIVEYYKSFDRDKLFLNQLSIQVNNNNNFFSLENNISIYKNINWRGQKVKLYNPENALIWDGELHNIVRNHASAVAVLISQNILYTKRYSKISYVSSDWETGSNAVKNILTNNNITNIDINSFNLSNQILDTAGAYLKINLAEVDNKNLIETLETIAKYSNADIYDYKGKIYFQVWRDPSSLIPSVLINDNDILTPLQVEVMDKLIINNYVISYYNDGGTPATDAINNNIGQLSRTRNGNYGFELTSTSFVSLKDNTTAVYIGEQAIKRTHKNININPTGLSRINFSIPINAGKYLDLTNAFKLTYQQESWINKIFEIYKISFDYEKYIIELECFELGS